MGVKSKIAWTDSTYNPWQGCHKVSAGCANCYMYREKAHYGQDPSTVVRSKPPTFNMPLKLPSGNKVFVCSWSDFFIEEADPWRAEAWAIIRSRPDLTFMILTKRQDRMREIIKEPLPNVWLGVTAENQEMADLRIPVLLQTPAAKRFVSVEPMLGPVDIAKYLIPCEGCLDCVAARCYPIAVHPLLLKKAEERPRCGNRGNTALSWIIAGSETGPSKRIMDNKWAAELRDQCKSANISFFFKNDSTGSDILYGVRYHEFPR